MTTTDQQAVTVAEETMTRPGYVVWHSSEEEGGPDVGITVGLGEGKMLWVGERSGREGDGIGLLVYGDKSIDANASLGEYDEIRDLIEQHVAPALSRLASVSSASAERRPDGRAVPGDARTINGDLHFYRAAGWYPAPTPEPVPATNQAAEVERVREIMARLPAAPWRVTRSLLDGFGASLEVDNGNNFGNIGHIRDYDTACALADLVREVAALVTKPQDEGRVLVPRLATRAMVDAADSCIDAYSAWSAMVEASDVH